MKKLLSLLLVAGATGCAAKYSAAPQSWKSVQLHMSRAQVYALVGRPDSSEPEQRDAQKDSVIYAHDSWQHDINAKETVTLDASYDRNGEVVSVGHGNARVTSVHEVRPD